MHGDADEDGNRYLHVLLSFLAGGRCGIDKEDEGQLECNRRNNFSGYSKAVLRNGIKETQALLFTGKQTISISGGERKF
jgi:hypothetical protein